ncbi:MAG: nitroreductase [Desulfosalsimonas sp.]
MNVIEAIKKRNSIRGFKTEPVASGVIESILETAVYAPSALNSQPWEFTVVAGEVLENICRENIENLRSGQSGGPEHTTGLWPKDSVFRQRQVGLAKQLFSLMGIEREDKEKRQQWLERGFRFFDAPAAVIISTDRVLGESGPLLDIGAVMQNICLVALEHGLGTCIEDQGVYYPGVIRKYTGIDESKNIVIAIAVGYPDPEFPANRVDSGRVPVSENTTWLGFS